MPLFEKSLNLWRVVMKTHATKNASFGFTTMEPFTIHIGVRSAEASACALSSRDTVLRSMPLFEKSLNCETLVETGTQIQSRAKEAQSALRIEVLPQTRNARVSDLRTRELCAGLRGIASCLRSRQANRAQESCEARDDPRVPHEVRLDCAQGSLRKVDR